MYHYSLNILTLLRVLWVLMMLPLYTNYSSSIILCTYNTFFFHHICGPVALSQFIGIYHLVSSLSFLLSHVLLIGVGFARSLSYLSVCLPPFYLLTR